MKIGVVLLLPSRGGSLIINNKVDRKRGTFESNVNVKGSID